MKKLSTAITVCVILFILASCGGDIHSTDDTESVNRMWWEYEFPELEAALHHVLYVDLESGPVRIQNTTPAVTWSIGPIDKPTFDFAGDIIDETAAVLKVADIDADRMPAGMGIPFWIGSETWENYSFSFDVFIGALECIMFAIHNETRTIICSELNTEARYWFCLKNDGRVAFNTTFGHDWYWIGQAADFSPNVWNNVELKFIEGTLNIFINGEGIGYVNEADEAGRGRIALGGGVGAMFGNLQIRNCMSG